MKQWLEGGAIPNSPQLAADLTGVEYGYVMKDGRDAIQLEKKEDMKRRGLASPDAGDALALTFAMPVEGRDHSRDLSGRPSYEYQYDPHAEMFQRTKDKNPYYRDRGGRFEQEWEPEYFRKR